MIKQTQPSTSDNPDVLFYQIEQVFDQRPLTIRPATNLMRDLRRDLESILHTHGVFLMSVQVTISGKRFSTVLRVGAGGWERRIAVDGRTATGIRKATCDQILRLIKREHEFFG